MSVLHLRNAKANCLGVLGFVSPPVGQALIVHSVGGDAGALLVMNSKLAAVVIAEGELVEITLKVLLAAVLVDASHPALEDAEEAPRPSW